MMMGTTFLLLGLLSMQVCGEPVERSIKQVLARHESTINDLKGQMSAIQSQNMDLQAQVKELTNEIDTLKERDVRDDSRVAFTVTRSGGSVDPGVGEKIQYDTIITNVGGGYVAARDEFVAPVPGSYAFQKSILANLNSNCHLAFYRNDVAMLRSIWSNSDGQGSNMMVFELDGGDTISVRPILDGCSLNANERMWCSFAGFLIAQRDE